jgi:hypothetical protein
MEAATVTRAKRATEGIAGKFNVHEVYIIFVDHQNKRASAMHFQEAEKAFFKIGDSMYERKAEFWPTSTIMDGTANTKFRHVMWDDAVEIWTPGMTYLCTRRGIIEVAQNNEQRSSWIGR